MLELLKAFVVVCFVGLLSYVCLIQSRDQRDQCNAEFRISAASADTRGATYTSSVLSLSIRLRLLLPAGHPANASAPILSLMGCCVPTSEHGSPLLCRIRLTSLTGLGPRLRAALMLRCHRPLNKDLDS
jgi:hypothetical protein